MGMVSTPSLTAAADDPWILQFIGSSCHLRRYLTKGTECAAAVLEQQVDTTSAASTDVGFSYVVEVSH